MQNSSEFTFHDELNDFLHQSKRNISFSHSFTDHPSIKDTIESLGIPHTEIELIIVNGEPVPFTYQLKNGDKVDVYPVSSAEKISDKKLLRPPISKITFIIDANIAKLAKYLRLMGFDTYYDFYLPDKDISEKAQFEQRIIITRDLGLLKRKTSIYGYFLRATNIDEQIKETVNRFKLIPLINPFSICLECNGKITPVEKSIAEKVLKPEVLNDYEEFYQCSSCHKIYWKGSHYDKMVELLESIRNTGNLQA